MIAKFGEADLCDIDQPTRYRITDRMVAGHHVDDRAVKDLLGRVVLVIAHNASFARRFLE